MSKLLRKDPCEEPREVCPKISYEPLNSEDCSEVVLNCKTWRCYPSCGAI